MGIVKFIELGVWPVKLWLYCFNTSGSLHSNLPQVTIEMNEHSYFQRNTKHGSLNTYQKQNKRFPMLSTSLRGDRDICPRAYNSRLSRWLCTCRKTTLARHTWAETHLAAVSPSCLLKRSRLPNANLDMFKASAGLLLSTEQGFLLHFLLEQIWLIASVFAQQH